MFDRNNTEITLPKAFNEQCILVPYIIDCSSSQSGKPIEAQAKTFNYFVDTIKEDPECAEKIYICVIGFHDKAFVLQDWTPANEMKALPVPQTTGCTNIPAGIELAEQKTRQITSYFEAMGVQLYKPQYVATGDFFSTVNATDCAKRICERQRLGRLKLWIGATTNGEVCQNDVENKAVNIGYDRKVVAMLTDGGARVFHIDSNNLFRDLKELMNFLAISFKNLSRSAPGERAMPGPPPNLSNPNLESWLND